MLKFTYNITGKCREGQVVYLAKEYSFDFYNNNEKGISSLLINDLQLQIDEFGNVLYAWGYCPHVSWIVDLSLMPPPTSKGEIIVMGKTEFKKGVSYHVNEDQKWLAYSNKSNGWICIGDKDCLNERCFFVEFATGSIAAISQNNYLKAIWLHPLFIK